MRDTSLILSLSLSLSNDSVYIARTLEGEAQTVG
jgi:hypothetical protein